ncbi:MAG: hypothetical protein Q9160_001726 [Pyrenula sp. 1 TL-2023]
MDPSKMLTQDCDGLLSQAFAESGIEQAPADDGNRQPGFDWGELPPLEGFDNQWGDWLNTGLTLPGDEVVFGTEQAPSQQEPAHPTTQSAVLNAPSQHQEGSGEANAQTMFPQPSLEQEFGAGFFNDFDKYIAKQSQLDEATAELASQNPQTGPESTVQAGNTQQPHDDSLFGGSASERGGYSTPEQATQNSEPESAVQVENPQQLQSDSVFSTPSSNHEQSTPEQTETRNPQTMQPTEPQNGGTHKPTSSSSRTSSLTDDRESRQSSRSFDLQRSEEILQSNVDNGHMENFARFMARTEPERLAALQRSQSNAHHKVRPSHSPGQSSDTVTYHGNDLPASWNDNLAPVDQRSQPSSSRQNPRKRKASDEQDVNLRPIQQASKRAKTRDASQASSTQRAKPSRQRKQKETKNAPPEGGPAPHEIFADIEAGRIFNPVCPAVPRPERRLKPFRNHPWRHPPVPAGLRLTEICVQYPSYTATSEVIWWFMEAGWSARQIIKMLSLECYRELSHDQPWSRWQQRMRWVKLEHQKHPERFGSVASQCGNWNWSDPDAEGEDDPDYALGFGGPAAGDEVGDEFEEEFEDEDQMGYVHATDEDYTDSLSVSDEEEGLPERYLGAESFAEGHNKFPAPLNEARNMSQVPLTTNTTRLGVTTGVWYPPQQALDVLKFRRADKKDELYRMKEAIIKLARNELQNLEHIFALSDRWDLLSPRLRQDTVNQGLLCIFAGEWRARFGHNHNPEHFGNMDAFLKIERAAIYAKQMAAQQYLGQDVSWNLLSAAITEQAEYHHELNNIITMARQRNAHGNAYLQWFETHVSSRLSIPPNAEWQEVRQAWMGRHSVQPRASNVPRGQPHLSTPPAGQKRKRNEISDEVESQPGPSTRPAPKRPRRAETSTS